MAGSSAGSIFVDLLLKDAQYTSGLKRAGKITGDFERSIKSLLGQLAPLIGGAGFAAIAGSALNAAEAINDASQQLGLSAEDYQKLAYSFKLGGVEAEKFQAAVGFLNNKIAEGKTPYKDTASAIAAIADQTANAKTGIDRAGIATENFGAKAGRAMIPTLVEGAARLRAMGDEAEKMGIIFSDQLVADADKFKDQIETLGMVIKTNFQAELLKGFVDESGKIAKIYTNQGFIDGVRLIGQAFGALAGYVVNSVQAFMEARVALGGFFIGVGRAIGAIDKDVADEALLDASRRVAELKKVIEIPNIPKSGGTGTFTPDSSRAKANKELEETARLYEKNIKYIDGLDDATRKYMEASSDLEALLGKGSLTWDQYAAAIKRVDEEFEKNKKSVNKWGIDLSSFGKKAAENIQDAFAEFLFDPFAQGTKGMLKGFVDTVRKMIAEAQAAALAKKLFGEDAGGTGKGIFGDIFGTIGSFLNGGGGGGFKLPFFAAGGYLGPGQWGVAGEGKNNAELLYGGRTGVSVFNQGQIGRGNTYNIDARGTDSSVLRRMEQLLQAELGPGKIEHRVADASARGMI